MMKDGRAGREVEQWRSHLDSLFNPAVTRIVLERASDGRMEIVRVEFGGNAAEAAGAFFSRGSAPT